MSIYKWSWNCSCRWTIFGNLPLLQLPPPILDDFGRVIADQQQQDYWPARCGIAMALEKISPILPCDQLLPLFHFYVQKGLRDRRDEVRSHMRTAALAAINVHGKVGKAYFITFVTIRAISLSRDYSLYEWINISWGNFLEIVSCLCKERIIWKNVVCKILA